MRELIKHILKENNLKQELKKVIDDDNIFKAADLVGGMDNLKSIFKDDPEMSSLFEKLTGTVTFYYIGYLGFPLEYEIIGRNSNIPKTNHWPVINVIYDENKLPLISFDAAYNYYCVFCNTNSYKFIVSKRYFEKYFKFYCANHIVYEKFIETSSFIEA